VTVDFERVNLEVTTIAKSIGYRLKKYLYYDTPDLFSRKSLDNILNTITFGSDDIVFFFYSGHGGRAENEKTIFPEMVLKVPYGPIQDINQLYPLYDVYSRLKRKSPRLVIVMGDMCNSVIDGFFRNYNSTNKGATVVSKGTCDVYKNLFLNVKGGIIASSSKPEETSGCYMIQQNGKLYDAGGYLTYSFIGLLQYYVTQGENISWGNLLNDVTSWTKEATNNRQTPVFRTELVKAESPVNHSSSGHSQPTTPIASNDASMNQRDDLAYKLSLVCNDKVSKLDRIHNIPIAQRLFSNSRARVQVVGCDNRTIVNTCTIESYLNYLSIATQMDQVVVLQTTKDGTGKINSMRVHEIHYQ
jgi:hypothetical protein